MWKDDAAHVGCVLTTALDHVTDDSLSLCTVGIVRRPAFQQAFIINAFNPDAGEAMTDILTSLLL
jgi:hypothetical protein